MITDQEKVTLHQLMAKATDVGPDFNYDHLDSLVTLGKGMFYSRFGPRVIMLAGEINTELEKWEQDS